MNELEVLDDTYFQKDRDTKINEKYASILEMVERDHAAHGKLLDFDSLGDDKKKESEYLGLKSKAMDFMPEHQVAAKEGLEKAVELDPENSEATRDLGVAFYKLRDYDKSISLYTKALELNKDDKKLLGYLSMAMRSAPTKSDDQKLENLNKGIEFAKVAVNLDINDSHSWYLLGNSYMTSFFATEKYDDLDKSLKAYMQAEKLQKYPNPDLYNNRATIFTYFERYSEAIRDYMRANTIDPGLNASDKAEQICSFVIGTTRMIEQKKSAKNKKIQDMVKTIPKKVGEVKFLSTKENDQTLKYKLQDQSELNAGENLGVIFCGKVICQIHKSPDVPACFLCIDSKSNFTVLSLYNINKGIKDKINYGDEILIRDPTLIFISIEYESRLLTYPCIKVINLSDILVNEQTLADVYSRVEAVSAN